MFSELGYNKVREDDDYIVYERKVDDDIYKVVSFCGQCRSVKVEFEYRGSLKVGFTTPSIDIGLFKAINKKLIDLGWFRGVVLRLMVNYHRSFLLSQLFK